MYDDPSSQGGNIMADPTILTFHAQGPQGVITRDPEVAIFSGIHGNEIGGILAMRQLIRDLRDGKLVLKRGTLHLAFANLAAIALGTRFAQMNMNRAFHFHSADVAEELRLSYERLRAIELQILLEKSDALLDLHSTDHESSPFIICEPHSFDIARALPFSIVSTGWDAVHPGSTDAYMNRQGKVGICVECGQHDDPEAKQRARQSIEVFLMKHDMIDLPNPPMPVPQRHIRAREIYRAKQHFRLMLEDLPEFAQLNPGTVIGVDGERAVTINRPSILIFPKDGAQAGEEAFVLGDELSM